MLSQGLTACTALTSPCHSDTCPSDSQVWCGSQKLVKRTAAALLLQLSQQQCCCTWQLETVSHCTLLHCLKQLRLALQAADRIVLAAEVAAVLSLVPLIVLKYVQA